MQKPFPRLFLDSSIVLNDETLELPGDLSLNEFRQMLRDALEVQFPGFELNEPYVDSVTAWDFSKRWEFGYQLYRIPFTLAGEGDKVTVTFGQAVKARMVPKVITDEQDSATKPVILSDSAEQAGGKPLRFRLPGPVAGVVNGNKRLYPKQVLTDAMVQAKLDAQARRMCAEEPHPESYVGMDGSVNFKTSLGNRVALIYDCFMDEAGQTYWDYEVIRTSKGKDLEANVLAGAILGSSVRAYGDSVFIDHEGDKIEVAREMTIVTNDIVTNPALRSAAAHPVILTDSQIEVAVAKSFDELRDRARTRSPHASGAPETQDPIKVMEDENLAKENEETNTSGTSAALASSAQPIPAPETAAPAAQPQAININLNLNGNGQVQAETPAVTPAPAPAETVDPVPVAQAAAAGAGQQPTPVTLPEGSVILDAAQHAIFTDFINERAEGGKKKRVGDFLDSLEKGEPGVHPTAKEGDAPVAVDLSRFDDETRKAILDSCREASPETVSVMLDGAIRAFDKAISSGRLQAMGYGNAPGGTGATHQGASVFVDEDKSWMEHVEKLTTAMDEHGRTVSGRYNTVSPEFRAGLKKTNQGFADSVINQLLGNPQQGRNMVDSSRRFLDDAGTLASYLQQPLITPATAALLKQVFWSLRWLPMVQGIGPDGFKADPEVNQIGANLRIPVETRPSGQSANYYVGEREAIPTIHPSLKWLNFSPSWMRTAFELSKEAEHELANGPERYNALARNLFTIAQVISEFIDLRLALEHYTASDEFEAVKVVDEARSDATFLSGGTLPAGYGANVTHAIKHANTVTVGGVTFPRPIVMPRTTRVIQQDDAYHSQTLNSVLNPIVVKVNDAPIIVGELSDTMMIVDGETPGALCAVDYENGTVVFKAGVIGAGDAVKLTYSYATNIDYFDLAPSSAAADLALFYDKVLRRIDLTAAQMGKAPRLMPPTEAIFSLENAIFPQSARMAQGLFTPQGSNVVLTEANPNQFGNRSGISYHKLNTPLPQVDSRILLKPTGASKYGIQVPFQVEGPRSNYTGKIVNGQVVLEPIDSQFWIARQSSVMCTPVCFTLNEDGSVKLLNHPYRTIKMVGSGTV